MKKPSQREIVRRHLLEHGSLTNVEAVEKHILRLSERIRELQAAGMQIESKRIFVDGKMTGTHRYTYLGPPTPKLVWMRTPEGSDTQVHESRVEEAKARGLTMSN